MVRNDHKFFGGEGLHRIYPIVLINGKEFALKRRYDVLTPKLRFMYLLFKVNKAVSMISGYDLYDDASSFFLKKKRHLGALVVNC